MDPNFEGMDSNREGFSDLSSDEEEEYDPVQAEKTLIEEKIARIENHLSKIKQAVLRGEEDPESAEVSEEIFNKRIAECRRRISDLS